MTELRFTGHDGDYVLLESLTGEKFRLLVDDSLRATVKRSGQSSALSVQLTPREIQSEIRSGKSVDELISRSSDPRHYVEKFAAPVLDELSHVIASALSVRISIAGDRHTDISHIEFGDIISGRLEASGVTDFEWTARRDEQQVWLVSANYEINGESRRATWSYDAKRMLLAPENENAIRLSTQNSLAEQNYAKLSVAQEPKQPDVDLGITQSLADTQLVETVIPIGRTSEFNQDQFDVEAQEPPTDLLEALKKKREERSVRDSDQVEPEPRTQNLEIVPDYEQTFEVGEEPQPDPDEIAPNPAPVRRSGRPSIPSFDEIVQGTKSEDE
jgi:hypothetical protein